MTGGRHHPQADEPSRADAPPPNRALRLLLRLYPRDFRDRFGAEMLATWAEQWRRPRSTVGSAAFVLHFARDLIASAAAEWLERRRHAAVEPLDRRLPSAGATRRESLIAAVVNDVRFAIRSVRRRPSFAAAVVLTIALGIGPNTAVFSLVDAVLLRPIPVHDPGRVVSLVASNARWNGRLAYLDVHDLGERARTIDGLAAWAPFEVALETGESVERLSAGLVTGSYFQVLGLRPAAGRLLGPDDERSRGASPYVVIAHGLWTRRFGADPAAVGRTIRLGGRAFTIVGVAPRRFRGTDLAGALDLWIPVTMNQSLPLGGIFARAEVLDNRTIPLMHAFGRLAEGASPQRATTELNAHYARLRAEFPRRELARDSVPNPIAIAPIAQTAVLADRADLVLFLRMMVATVGLTLLIAIVNAANLLLVRADQRTRELRLRTVLGAGRVRLVRQMLAESVLLALAGGAAGLAVAVATTRLLSAFTLPGDIALDRMDLMPNAGVLVFTFGLSLVAAVACGLAPALRGSSHRLEGIASLGGDRVTGRPPRGAMVAAQVAITFVLLVGATLFVRSMRAGLDTDLGFDPGSLVAIDLQPRLQGLTEPQTVALYRSIAERAAALPGVGAVAVTSHLPLETHSTLPFRLIGASGSGDEAIGSLAGAPELEMGVASISPSFFQTIGVPLRAGRAFTDADDDGALKVIILNESAARAIFGSENPLGRRISMMGVLEYTVVGVVADTKYATLAERNVPFAYAPISQDVIWSSTVVARPRTGAPVLPALQTILRELAPGIPQVRPRRVASQVDQVLMPQRFGATLLTAFGLLALAISAVGVYGTVAYTVSRQQPEIGIRIALGAQWSDVVRLVVWRTGVGLVLGTVIGVLGAAVGSRAVASFLYGVTPSDAASFAVAAIVIVATAVLVSFVPARRATRVDPVTSIRSV